MIRTNLKKILSTIDSNKFNHKKKIGKFKFNVINDLISNIKNNTISEADTKKKIDKLNETKKLETKGKRLIKNQEKLLILFDDLVEAISNNNNSNNSNSSNINNNNKSDSVIVNKDKNKNESENEGGNVSENENHDVQYYEIKQINNIFKKIDETKPFEDKIDILKKYQNQMITGILSIVKIIKRQILDYLN